MSPAKPSLRKKRATEHAIRLGAAVWISSVQFFVAQAVVQSAWTTRFSLSENFISDLGNTVCGDYPPGSGSYVCSPWHAWMNLSFVLLGVQILAGALLARNAFARGGLRAASIWLLAIAGIGAALVGFYPENVENAIHRFGAGANFVCGNLAICLLGIAVARARGGAGVALFSIASGLAGLAATYLLVTDVYLGLGVGGMERVAAYALPIWMIAIGVVLLVRRGAKLSRPWKAPAAPRRSSRAAPRPTSRRAPRATSQDARPRKRRGAQNRTPSRSR
jgi:hypothetical membrane protein